MIRRLVAWARGGRKSGVRPNDAVPRAVSGEAALRGGLATLERRVAAIERRGSPGAGRPAGAERRDEASVASLRAQAHRLVAAGHSQAEAARRLGVTRQYVHKLIRRRS